MDNFPKMMDAMVTALWVKRVPQEWKPWMMKRRDTERYFDLEPGTGFLRLDCHEIEIPAHESVAGLDPRNHYAAMKRLDDGALAFIGVVGQGDLRDVLDLLDAKDMEIVLAKH